MIIDNSVTEVEFTGLRAGDYVITTGRSSTYRLIVKEQLYTAEKRLAVSTIVKIEKEPPEPLLGWWHMGSGIITSMKEGCSAIFTEAAGYEYPFLNTSPVRSLTLYYNLRLNTQALR